MSQQQVQEALQAQIGQEIHRSDWLEITQARIDAFAEATGDRQWIHVDPERAARESPWKATIAHGYLTLSLYPMLRGLVAADHEAYPGVRQVINYGLDKLRFPSAVRCGSRVRALHAAQGGARHRRAAGERAVHRGHRRRAEAGLRGRGDHAALLLAAIATFRPGMITVLLVGYSAPRIDNATRGVP